jgi:O-antigen/teichoic acid export membrane protein
MRKPSLGGNIASMMVWQIGNYVIPLLTFPYLTRTLGVRSFGEFGLAFAVATYLVLVTDYGFNLSAPGEIARHREDEERVSRIFWSVVSAKAVLLALCLGGLAIATLLFDAVGDLAPVLFAASGMAVANLFNMNWCLQGFERLGKSAIAMTLGRALTVPATLLLVHTPDDAWIAAAVQAGGAITASLISVVMLRGLGVIRWRPAGLAAAWTQLRDAWPLFVSAVSVTLYTTTNTVVLGALRGPSAVGVFAAADRLRAAAQGAIQPISQAVYPHATRLMHQSQDGGVRFARRLLLLQGAFTLVISLVLFFGADLIIAILAGPRFGDAVPVLRWLSPIPFMVGITNVLGIQLMLPLGMKTQFSRVLALAAVCDLALIFPLSWYFGPQGTAIAALVAESVVVAGMMLTLSAAKVDFLPRRRSSHAVN